MEARYARRNSHRLQACQVAPEIFDQVRPRVHTCMNPFVASWRGPARPQPAETSVSGLRPDVERTHVASIASHVGQDRLGLQGCIGWADWDDAPLRQAWLGHVGTHVGQAEGVWVCDPSAFPTSGRASVGVARQGCGRLGNVDTCHVALSLGDVSRKGHTLVDLRRSLPNAWTQEKARRRKAAVPKEPHGDRTRHPWALERLANNGASRLHRWRAGDDARGRPAWCRRRLAAWGERARLAVPSHTLPRDLETPVPDDRGQGRPPTRPWQAVATWADWLADDAWRRIEVREGRQGPLGVDAVTRRVVSRTHRRQHGDAELVVVIRDRDRDNPQVGNVDVYRSHAAPETPLGACARVATAEHRIEACLQRSQSEAGLAGDEVRHGTGWQHHHTRS